MPIKYTVFDVETPNCYNDRICSVGITTMEDSVIKSNTNILVDPDCPFSEKNIEVHGIKPENVRNCPSFPKVWESIRELFQEDSVLIAHNAVFDLSVLRKTLAHYNIKVDCFLYADTLKIARDVYSGFENYKLSTICRELSIELDHHNSGSDSLASAILLQRVLEKGIDISPYYTLFPLDESADRCITFHNKRICSVASKELLELKQILSEISEDGKIDRCEFTFLNGWIEDHKELKGNYPYDAILDSLERTLEDKKVDPEELQSLLELSEKLTDPVSSCASDSYCLSVEGKNIVLTGEFIKGSRAVVSELLQRMNANIQQGVTKKTDYVLVGAYGSEDWVAGNYGSKIKKAIELQEKGCKIEIIKEKDFFESMEKKDGTDDDQRI